LYHIFITPIYQQYTAYEKKKISNDHEIIVRQLFYDRLIYCVLRHFQQYFSYIMATSFSGGRSRREPPTMGKQLVSFITCGCELRAPFYVIYKAGREPMPYW
jgi:hypothetical protein